MNNKLQLVKRIMLLVASSISSIISAYLYIASYSLWKDEYGTDISFNETYLVALIASLLLVFAAIYVLVKNDNRYTNITLSASTSLISFYGIGTFLKKLFKAIIKSKEKGKPLSEYFKFSDNQALLYIGIVTLFIAAYFIISAYMDYKNAKKN